MSRSLTNLVKATIAILLLSAGVSEFTCAPVHAEANAIMFCPGNMGYVDGLTANEINGYRTSGMNTMILFAMDVQANGDFTYGGNVIVSNGTYTGPSNWPGLLSQCRASGSSVSRMEMSIGGWGSQAFARIRSRIASDGTGSGTVLYRNLQALRNSLNIDAIDYDDEATYDTSSAAAFGNMIGAIGMKVTLCPYTNPAYWQAVKNGCGAVDGIYLQCYEGGAGNDPGTWNNYFGGMKVAPGYEDNNGATDFSNRINAQRNNGCTGGFLWPVCTGCNPPADGPHMTQYAGLIHSALDINTRPSYKAVASENQTVTFNTPADIAYGANGSYAYRYDVLGSVTFNNATFGDPKPGVGKSGFAGYYWQSVSEGNSATFSVPVEAAYGANGHFRFGNVSGTVTFNNATWGDPAPGASKSGYVLPYQQCAVENGSFNFTSPTDVAYGANGKFNFRFGVTGNVTFNNSTFGDPAPGLAKGGYYRPSH